ncbi:hypothetical protein [Isoptericola sp. NPDC057653]|uniref:hypothetical protein n=1 Tax=Isoptericola sp. NPDC057653 TaxID=3346195 RepID=UPI0036A38900
MALLPRLRQLLRRPFSASTVAARRPTPSQPHGEHLHEDALRTILTDDPNDARAFRALAEIVRRRAAQTPNPEDPLTAPPEEARQRAADLAVWSLAEELAGHPRAWRPLLELGRLSVADDPEGASRRLATAASREPSGEALAEGLAILREAGMPTEALGLGIGHWRAREHTPEVGRHLVLAALEADRVAEARQHLASLELHPGTKELRAELGRAVAAREQTSPR